MAAVDDESEDGKIYLWQVSGSKLVAQSPIKAHDDGISIVRFSRDGKLLVTGSWDGTLKLWSLDNAELIQLLAGHHAPINAIDFHPSQSLIASGAEDGNLIIWEFSPDKLLQYSCHRLQDYLTTNPNLSRSDRQLCPNVSPNR